MSSELGKNSLLRFFLLSLSLLCAEAKEDGWAQVTASTLQPRADVESNICEFKPWCVAPPEYFTAEAIFRHLFTGVISRLVQDMNASFKQRHQGPRDTKVRTTEHQMWALVAVLIRVMAEQKRLLKETVRDKEFASWNKLSIYVTERLSGAMVASYELLFAAFNHSLAATVQVRLLLHLRIFVCRCDSFFRKAAGVSCVDEAILSFKGRSPFRIRIPKKPHPVGLRVFTQVFRLTASRCPVLVRILPELRRPIYSPVEILDFFPFITLL